jgi:hypothetical protein
LLLTLTRNIVENIEASVLSAKKSVLTGILIRAALLVGHDLLPERVKHKYELGLLQTWWGRPAQTFLNAAVWLIYPMLMWLPLRGMICLLLVLEPSLRRLFMVS